MFKGPLTQSHVVFFGSILLPYLLDLLPSHSGGYHTAETLLLDFTALVLLGISSLMLALKKPELRRNGKGLLFPAFAFASVALYFYSLDVRIVIREQVEFFFRKSELEAYVAQSNQDLSITDNSTTPYPASPNVNLLYPKPSLNIVFCYTEGEVSVYSGGYAYSPADKKPLDSNYYEWRKLSGHWYRWKRHEG